MNPLDLLAQLQQTSLFREWKKEHSETFLSHFFCTLGADFQVKTPWDTGYFNPQDEKITIFTPEKNSFIIKPEEDVFKKETTTVESLDTAKIKFLFPEAITLLKEKMPSLFPQELFGDGFVILQHFSGKTEWNFTFVSKTFKFLNVKINAEDGSLNSHQTVSLVQKDHKNA